MTSLENLCGSVGICADLHLLDANNRTLYIAQGTTATIGLVENVEKVQSIGSGCYTIFEEENFKGGLIFLTGNETLNLKEADFDKTGVRYVPLRVN